MRLVKKDFTIWKGTRFEEPFRWLQGNDKQPKDLTGWKAVLKVRPNVLSEDVLLELTTENGGITIDGPTATFYLIVPSAQSGAFTWEYGDYDFRFIRPDGEPVLFMQGRFNVALSNSR